MSESKRSSELEKFIRLSRLKRLAGQSKVPASLVTIYSELLGGKNGASQQEKSPVARLEMALESSQFSWRQVAEIFYSILKKAYSKQLAQQALWLALKFAKPSELAEFVGFFSSSRVYPTMSEPLRERLVVDLWLANELDVLNQILHRLDDSCELVGVEKLFVFWSLAQLEEPFEAWRYYETERLALLKAHEQYAARLGIESAHFFYTLAELARRCLQPRAAASLYARLDPNSALFRAAYEAMLFYPYSAEEKLEFLESMPESSTDKLAFLKEHLLSCASKDARGLAELAFWKEWLPKGFSSLEASHWRGFSQILVEIISNHSPAEMFLAAYEAYHFDWQLEEDLRRDLWDPCLTGNSRFRATKLSALAAFHSYVLKQDLVQLAQARTRCIEEQGLSFYAEIKDSFLSYVGRSVSIPANQKSRIQWQFQFIESFEEGTPIEQLTKRAQQVDYTFISDLVTTRGDQPPPIIEIASIRARSIDFRFSNKQVDRLWKLSVESRDYDLAWRCVAILKEREALSTSLAARYRSGIERKRLNFAALDPCEYLAAIAYGFEADQRAFMIALLRVGQLLPELLAMVSKQISWVRVSSSKQSLAREIEDYLEENNAFYGFTRKHRWQSKQEDQLEPTQGLGESVWCQLVEQLSRCYGFQAWHWRLSELYQKLESTWVGLSRGKEVKIPAKLMKSLRSMNANQRLAWYELASIAKKLEDEKAQRVMIALLVRIASLIYPAHHEALSASKHLGLEALGDLEAFVLSDEYSKARKKLQQIHYLRFGEDSPPSAL